MVRLCLKKQYFPGFSEAGATKRSHPGIFSYETGRRRKSYGDVSLRVPSDMYNL